MVKAKLVGELLEPIPKSNLEAMMLAAESPAALCGQQTRRLAFLYTRPLCQLAASLHMTLGRLFFEF
jgi:hypothetical protein